MNPRSERCFSRYRAGLALAALLSLGACGSAALNPEQRAFQERYARAKALFEQRCKTAGVVIHRTVKDVEGIELTKIRQPVPWGGKEYFDPMWPEAAMAGEKRGEYYIKQFLMAEFRVTERPAERGGLAPPTRPSRLGFSGPFHGYRFVEYLDPNDLSRRRCSLVLKAGEHSWEGTSLNCQVVPESSTRYALDYDDLVDPQDRQLWVAGVKLKVTDKKTKETLAQLTKFIWDPGFGASTTGRWPWQHADGRGPGQNCPYEPSKLTGSDSRYFVDTVLIPNQGD